MTCHEALPLLTGLADDELDPHRTDKVRRHLEACAECAAYLNEERALKALLARVPPPPVPEALHGRLVRILDRGGGAGPRVLRFAAAAAGLAAIVAALVVLQALEPRFAVAGEGDLAAMHEANLSQGVRLCGCCSKLGKAILHHAPGTRLELPSDYEILGYVLPESDGFSGRPPCFSGKTRHGAVSIFVLDRPPLLADAVPAAVERRACLVLERGDRTFLVICGQGSARSVVWVADMPREKLMDIVFAR